jgi:hypothetical protein
MKIPGAGQLIVRAVTVLAGLMRRKLVMMIEGELTLVEDEGETMLRAGDFAAFPKNTGNGHHLINRFIGDGNLSRSGLAPAARSNHLLRHRHEERELRRPIRAQ